MTLLTFNAVTPMQKRTRLTILLFCCFFLTGGSPALELEGIDRIPQSPLLYEASFPDAPLIGAQEQDRLYRHMRERFFSPWNQKIPRDAQQTLDHILRRYSSLNTFGENRQPHDERWLSAMQRACRIEAIGELGQKAVSLRATSLRSLPTARPAFLSPDLPGEGYPFDLLQNSLVHGGEPLFVSHYSQDRLFCWCDASYASGWVACSDLAWVDEEISRLWQNRAQAAIRREGVVLANEDQSYFKGTIGTVLPIVSMGATTIEVAVPTATENRQATEHRVVIPRTHAALMPMKSSPWNVAQLTEELMGQAYGWGGYLENRDCSATLRDIMLPMGIWLPRNSRAQVQEGRSVSLEHLSPQKKIEMIRRTGVPFFTLLGLPGHAALFIGSYRGEPIIFHSLWGIRTIKDGEEGRHVIGRTVLSTLDAGADLPHHAPGRLIIDQLNRMAVLVP